MDVYLMRIAPCEDVSILYPDDHIRPLTQVGERLTRAVADSLSDMVGDKFDRVLIYDNIRSRTSAKIITEQIPSIRRPQVDPLLNGEHPPEAIVSEWKQFSRLRKLLLIADGPVVNKLLAFLVSKDSTCRINMEPASVARVELNDDVILRNGILHWIVPAQCWVK